MEWPSGSLGLTGDFAGYHTPGAAKMTLHFNGNDFLKKRGLSPGHCVLFVNLRETSPPKPLPMLAAAGSTLCKTPGALVSAGRELSFPFRIASKSSSFPTSSARRCRHHHRRLPPVSLCSL